MELKKQIGIIIIIIVIMGAIFTTYYYYDSRDDPGPDKNIPLLGDLKRVDVNNTTDSTTFKVIIDPSFRDAEDSPIYDENNESNLRPRIVIKYGNNTPNQYVNPNYTYLDVDENGLVNTGDKLVIHNRSRYIGIKTNLNMLIHDGKLYRSPSGYYYDRI